MPRLLKSQRVAVSISDDDLCSDCQHCEYNPGLYSYCKAPTPDGRWPCEINEDHYVIKCPQFNKK
jgi:hypothetical protein